MLVTNIAWQENHSSQIRLDDGDIHIWSIPCLVTDDSLKICISFLDADELARAERFKFKLHQQRFVVARAALRSILARYILLSPQAVKFEYSPEGKPQLKDQPSFQFNMSHSHGLALCAVTRVIPVGVDIEYQQTNIAELNIARRYFSPAEQSILNNASKSQRRSVFLSLWTAKEAVVKAMGKGLVFGLDQFSIALHENGKAVLQSAREELKAKSWFVQNFTPALDYMAAIALPRKNNQLSFFTFSF